MLWKSLLAIAAWAALAVRSDAPRRADRSSPIDLAGELLVVANLDSASVSLVDTRSRTKTAEVRIGSTPQTVTIDGARAFVACDDGRLITIDLEAKRVGAVATVGVELYGVVTDGERLFVSDSGGAAVHVIDRDGHVRSIATEAYPRGLALQDERLYVTHFRTGRVSVIDTTALAVRSVISTGPDSNLSQAIAIAGTRAYLPQTRANVTNLALNFETTVFPVVSVIDLTIQDQVKAARFNLDALAGISNMPLDVALTPDGRMYVVNAGTDDVAVIDVSTRKLVRRFQVGANPRGIAMADDFAYVSNTLDGKVAVIDLATNTRVDEIAVTKIPLPPDVLRGKILFNTADLTTVAKDRWVSCATCHFEGGVDGRTWFFADGPRNTTPVWGVASTLPMHWSGDLDELQDVESTVRNIQAGTGLVLGPSHCEPACDRAAPNAGRAQALDDLAAYMAFVRAPRRSMPVPERGRELFAALDCATCHPAPLYTDRKKHDVGTATSDKERKGGAFDTPSLRGLFDTAPYFHDGSAATLHDVLARHGQAHVLTGAERDELVAFLRSIPFPEPKRRSAR